MESRLPIAEGVIVYTEPSGSVVITKRKRSKTGEKEWQENVVVYDIVPKGARSPYDIILKYWIIGRWEIIRGATPSESLERLHAIVAERFHIPITDELKDLVDAQRLARRMQ